MPIYIAITSTIQQKHNPNDIQGFHSVSRKAKDARRGGGRGEGGTGTNENGINDELLQHEEEEKGNERTPKQKVRLVCDLYVLLLLLSKT